MGMCCCPCLCGQPCQPRHPACCPILHAMGHLVPALPPHPLPQLLLPFMAPHGNAWGKIPPQACAPFLAMPVLVRRPLHPAPQARPPPALPSRTTPPSPYLRPFLAAPLPLLSPLPPRPRIHPTGPQTGHSPQGIISPVCPVPAGRSGQLTDLRWAREGGPGARAHRPLQ